MAPRGTQRYVLRDGRKIVQYGITDDVERRKEEHEADGKRFTSITPVRPKVTRETAETWEQDRIETYKRNHGGRGPRYNKT